MTTTNLWYPNSSDRGANRSSAATNLVFFGDSLSDNGNLFALTGTPPPPYWEGRFSNGPTFAEQLPGILGVRSAHVDNFAYGGAKATGTSVIDLDAQVQAYLAELGGRPAPRGTEAVLYIGNNDYLQYDPTSGAPPPVADVAVHIQAAIETLSANGVRKFVVFTLADFSISPAGQAADPAVVAGANAIIAANNATLKQLVAADNAAGLDISVVDVNVLGKAVSADFHAFGLKETAIPMIDQNGQPTGITAILAPNEIGFFDPLHPSTATHGIQAAFAAASLEAKHVQLFTDGDHAVSGSDAFDFIFAVDGGNRIGAGGGDDVVYSGNGGSIVQGGSGDDLIFAGGGNNHLYGDSGTDLLAVNSGDNSLAGGKGFDVFVANRSGNTQIDTGGGDSLVIFKEDTGSTAFGQQTVSGGGHTTLRFIINDQNAASEAALIAEFQEIAAAYQASLHTNHRGTFTVDGLDVHDVTGVQLQIDSVDPNIPYQIDHTIITVGHAPDLPSPAESLLHQAALWGLLTA